MPFRSLCVRLYALFFGHTPTNKNMTLIYLLFFAHACKLRMNSGFYESVQGLQSKKSGKIVLET